MPVYYKFGYKFVAPSNTEHKKYDVYDVKTDKKITSFGDRRYNHFNDKIGYYDHLNTNDIARRKLFKTRHEKNRHVYQSAAWFADRFLW
tara:strand:+ start:94 stop:360 length:267 start_codon:yes stop_codon:yes gene_type:complete